MKLLSEVLKEKGLYDLVIERCNLKETHELTIVENGGDCIDDMFYFADTPEGFDFWRELANEVAEKGIISDMYWEVKDKE